MIKCKICDKEINPHNLQAGGCHINCYSKDITAYKISVSYDINGSYYIEKDINKVKEAILNLQSDDDEGIVIKKITIFHGVYINLPEFQGF